MGTPDYYSTLRLPADATAEEVRAAYKRLAKEWHPDAHQGDEAKAAASAKFRSVQEAYDVLSDEGRRRAYDGARASSIPGVQLPADVQNAVGFWQEIGLAAATRAGEALRDGAPPIVDRLEGVARKTFDLSRTPEGQKKILAGIDLLASGLRFLDGSG